MADPVEAHTAASRGNGGPRDCGGFAAGGDACLKPRVCTRLGARREIAATSEILALARPIFGALARKQRPYRIGELAAVRLAAPAIGATPSSTEPRPVPKAAGKHRNCG